MIFSAAKALLQRHDVVPHLKRRQRNRNLRSRGARADTRLIDDDIPPLSNSGRHSRRPGHQVVRSLTGPLHAKDLRLRRHGCCVDQDGPAADETTATGSTVDDLSGGRRGSGGGSRAVQHHGLRLRHPVAEGERAARRRLLHQRPVVVLTATPAVTVPS